MSTVEFDNFEGTESESESNSKSMDLPVVKIKMPEAETETESEIRVEASAGNLSAENNVETRQNSGIFKGTGRKTRRSKLAFLCFASASVLTLLLVLVFLSTGGLGKGVKGNEKNADSAAGFPHRTQNHDSTHTQTAHEFLQPPRAERLQQEPENPETEEESGFDFGIGAITEAVIDYVLAVVKTLVENDITIIEAVDEMFNETISEMIILEERLEAQQEQINRTLVDLRAQVDHFHGNRSREADLDLLRAEFQKEISLLKDEMKSLRLNFSSNSAAPPTSAHFSTPVTNSQGRRRSGTKSLFIFLATLTIWCHM